MKYLFLLIAATFFLTPRALAQLDSVVDITINAIPSDPLPGQTVRLEAISYSIDLNQTNITWKYNDSVVAAGIGRTRISITAPSAGSSAVITATASGSGLSQNTATFILRSAGVDLIWEAYDTYTPPFYKGKALPASNAIIRVMAVPQPNAPRQLAYTWSRNSTTSQSSSGFQRNSFIFKNDILNPRENISVSVSGGSFSSRAETVITPVDPGITAYKKIEGFIDFSRGYLSEIPVEGQGVVIKFEPFFFSYKTNVLNDLIFDISNNGTPIIGDTAPNELRLSRPENGGSSQLRVSVTTIAYSLQNTIQDFIISFR